MNAKARATFQKIMLFLTGFVLMSAYMNCTNKSFTVGSSRSETTVPLDDGGNGNGYGGKIYVQLDTAGICTNASKAFAEVSVTEDKKAYLIRDNCVLLSPPLLIEASIEIIHDTRGPVEILRYADRVFERTDTTASLSSIPFQAERIVATGPVNFSRDGVYHISFTAVGNLAGQGKSVQGMLYLDGKPVYSYLLNNGSGATPIEYSLSVPIPAGVHEMSFAYSGVYAGSEFPIIEAIHILYSNPITSMADVGELTLPPYSPVGAVNLIDNPGFEFDLAGSWTTSIGTGVSRDAYTGGSSLVLNPTNHYAIQEVTAKIQPGQSLRLTAWAKRSSMEVASITISFFDNQGQFLKGSNVSITSTAYAQYTLSIKAPLVFAKASVSVTRSTAGDAIYVDDFDLR